MSSNLHAKIEMDEEGRNTDTGGRHVEKKAWNSNCKIQRQEVEVRLREGLFPLTHVRQDQS